MDLLKHQPCVELGGEWSFAYSLDPMGNKLRSAAELERAGLKVYPCTVPGNLELDLQRAGIIGEPFYGMNMAALRPFERAHVWYFRNFQAKEEPGADVELLFEGLDCFADIYLNGERIGSCDNMLVEHRFRVTRRLQRENELFIHIRPVYEEAIQHDYPVALGALGMNYDSLYVRKAPHMFGWDIMPRALSAGLWRPVRLRYRPLERLEEAYLETLDIAEGHGKARLALHYQAKTSGNAQDAYEIEVSGHCGAKAFTERRRMLFQAGAFSFGLDEPALWWPRGKGEARLYHCRVTLIRNGQELDSLAFDHGVRTVALDRTSITDPTGKGEFCFRINGEKVFVLGSNWVPVDAFHSRDVSRIPQIITLAEDIGCNMFRCWGGNVYENDLFFELCDQKGFMVWQDFAMACAVYPQDREFCERLEREARLVVRRLRQHPCLVLWSGDNECDMAYGWGGRRRDPNTNVLTRQVLPQVLREEDLSRPYLPSSPYADPVAFEAGETYLPEHHLWGPRDYYKGPFYKGSLCHFASEIGYHGCPSPASIRRFISPGKVWPYRDNEEWLLHATSPVPGVDLYDYRIELMAKQVRELFGQVPDTLSEFAFASQASQAEALKFFTELFRASKWRRTGLIWWNLIDGWPQFSDAVVDYYFQKKLAYSFIQRAQAPLCLVLKESENWRQVLVACNDTREALALEYSVHDVDTEETLASGRAVAAADGVTALAELPFSMGEKRFYLLAWQSALGSGRSHYLAGNLPFKLDRYRGWLEKAGFLSLEWLREGGF
jgi:beta-mannosidase